MSSHPKRPSLRVISGSGRQDASTGPSPAFVVDTPVASGQQLALPGVIPACTVVGVSPAALFARDLAETLREIRAHHVVDMRLAVEFGSLGLGRRDFDAIVRELGVTYRHFEGLATPYHGLAWNPAAKRAKFRDRLRLDPAYSALLQLRDLIDDGPVVLLSESPYHEDSERQFVIEALQEVRPGFASHHIDPVHREQRQQ